MKIKEWTEIVAYGIREVYWENKVNLFIPAVMCFNFAFYSWWLALWGTASVVFFTTSTYFMGVRDGIESSMAKLYGDNWKNGLEGIPDE